MNAALPVSDAQSPLTLTVNGRTITARAEPRTNLADFLRDGLDLTGTHLGCEHGVCGACTILIDGEPARSCLTFAVACDGSDVETIEGLDHDEITAELRAAFTREHALQCGYCTPGMLITARDLVIRLPDADERRVRLGLSGNLCRCTGYVGIVRAVRAVITERRTRGIAPQAGGAVRCIGPVGAGHGSATDLAQPTERHVRDVAAARAPIAVADFTPANSFTQDFTVTYPADEVFALFGRIEDVASCLPGAFITARPAADRVEGGIRVKVGPIAAAFAGTARITRDEAARSGRIIGAGADAGGRSTTQGMISYRVTDGPSVGTARVELQVGYTLKGALAQFSRPGLVRDLAARITVQFAANLEARLAGKVPASSTGGLNPLSLLIGMLRNRIASWFAART
jgi:aerobic carbon-monoxide dehydrogenase small subunit